MVHAQAVLHGDRERLLGFDAVEHPLALQLGGSDPAELALAARIGAEWGYDEINLNVGCPSDRVQAGRFGACLMRESGLVADCVAAMRAAVSVPVTVKCRLGVDEDADYDVLRAFVDPVAAAGCGIFVVHARKAWLQGLSPKENREVPPLRYEWVHRLKAERPDLLVVINGGLLSLDQVQAQLQHVDGAMLGRLAYQDPYALHCIARALYHPGSEPLPRAELLRSLQSYVQTMLSRGGALKHFSRHVLGLFHGEPGGKRYRQILSQQAHGVGAGWEVIEQALNAVESIAGERAA
jgi:tRNA-dihydrouridine synthase A